MYYWRSLPGVLLGHFYPSTGVEMKVLGDYFIKLIKIFIGPIIFLTIVLGISGMGDLKKWAVLDLNH